MSYRSGYANLFVVAIKISPYKYILPFSFSPHNIIYHSDRKFNMKLSELSSVLYKNRKTNFMTRMLFLQPIQ